MAMIADLRKELEREAEEENIPILRRAERKLLLEAAAAADPKRILEVGDRKSTRLNSSHTRPSRMPSSA